MFRGLVLVRVGVGLVTVSLYVFVRIVGPGALGPAGA